MSSGVTVIDRTCHVGEWCGRLLADLGARVVRLEPFGGSESRQRPPFAPDGTSLWWAARNYRKECAASDGNDIDSWLSQADVLVDSSLSYKEAHAITERHPRLIVTSITWCGLTGPYAAMVHNDDTVTALSGWLASSGRSTETPILVPGSLPSDGASVMAVFATLAALWQRQSTGQGQLIDVSALEATIQLDTWSISNASANSAGGMGARRIRSGEKQLYPVIRGTDGWSRLVMLAPRQWRAFWCWIGEPEAFADAYWDAAPNRFANTDVLAPLFERHFADMTTTEAATESQKRGVVVTPMSSPAQLLGDEHLRSRGTFAPTEVAPGVTAPLVDGLFEIDGRRLNGQPLTLPSVPTVPARPPERAHPLAGLKVVDFGHGGVGVQAGRLLAEHGADVIKIESRGYIDFMRVMAGSEMSPSFASSSRAKRSFGVDLKDPEGIALVKRLVAWADVVIENNSTGTMEKLGLGYDVLSAINPRLVYVSSQFLGSRGVRSNWSGYGPSVQAYGGLSFLWRHPGTEPPAHMANHPDMMAGHICAIAALTGVLRRSDSGRGAHCEVAQVEAVIATLNDLVMAEALAPGSVAPDGNTDVRGEPWGVFPCIGEHDYAVICCETSAHRAALERAIGCGPATNETVAEWTRTRTPWEVAHACQRERVPAAPMLYASELLADPHLVARGFGVSVDQPGLGPLVLEGSAFNATGMLRAIGNPAPSLGQNTREIARDILGLAESTIANLFDRKILEE